MLLGVLHHIPAAVLVVFRITGLMMYGPIFGSSAIPPRIRIGLSVMLGLAIYPALAGRPAVAGPLPLSLAALIPLVAVELSIGLVIGFLASLPLIAVQMGGLVMGQQMGLGFARFYNPALEDDADVLGQILFFTMLAGFLAIGGHEALVLAVMRSFDHLPLPALGQGRIDEGLLVLMAGMMGGVLELTLRVAAPLLAVIFLQTVAMGFVAKTVPQMNILSLGFPLRIISGLGIVTVGLVVINEVVMERMDTALGLIFRWIEGG